ncbi:MAG: 16S rRNA (adenine(1518)-N(6)/adenine(1519)-N(6))-dimethyltransferase RsmA [Candidatus Nanopelagicales bacterium]|nr:16S rRNA (adenine(1518)-N(6)/adenine(1519)-N(6))-dimethyltransferase RsmA [Candidatus Nanopelagicales bacterium]
MSAPPPSGRRLLGAGDVRRLAGELELHPAKRLGQNFVTDANTVRRIARLADVDADDVVLEVGPGLGSLTLALLELGCRVIAVEVDDRLARKLPGTVADFQPDAAGRLVVLTRDAVTIDELPEPPTALVANLPYNVAVPVLINCLTKFPSLRRGTVMVQAEVADRLAAAPGDAAYGVPSVKTAWFARVRHSGPVPASVFWPVPRAGSGLVSFESTEPPVTDVDRSVVFEVVDQAFSQRRKMLRTSLAKLFESREAASAAVERAGVRPDERPERLGPREFAAIARELGASRAGASPDA